MSSAHKQQQNTVSPVIAVSSSIVYGCQIVRCLFFLLLERKLTLTFIHKRVRLCICVRVSHVCVLYPL